MVPEKVITSNNNTITLQKQKKNEIKELYPLVKHILTGFLKMPHPKYKPCIVAKQRFWGKLRTQSILDKGYHSSFL